MLHKLIILTAIVLPTAALGHPPTQPASKATTSRTLAIAGIEAYAPSTNAEATLVRAGFTRSVSRDEFSFKGRVELALSQAQGKRGGNFSKASHYQVWNKGGESITLWFLQRPEGAVVKTVIYTLPTSIQSPNQVFAAMTRRYGNPDVAASNKHTGKTAHWCKPKSPKLCDYTDTNLLMTVIGNDITLRLNIDERQEKIVAAAVEAEARKQASRPSF